MLLKCFILTIKVYFIIYISRQNINTKEMLRIYFLTYFFKYSLTPWKSYQFVRAMIKTISPSIKSIGTLTLFRICIFLILSG